MEQITDDVRRVRIRAQLTSRGHRPVASPAPTIEPVDALTLLLAVVAPAPADSVNLWGALGCAVAYSAALLATLDGFADLILARDDSPAGRLTPAVGLKFGSKLAAAAIAVISAGIVLALDANWFAFTASDDRLPGRRRNRPRRAAATSASEIRQRFASRRVSTLTVADR